REVAVDRCRSQPVRAARLLDVALQPRLELLVDEPLPLLALRVLRAPVQPEERVAIDVAEQILDRQGLDVTRTEEGWIRDVDVARRPARRALCVHRLRLLLQRRALGDTLDHVAMPRAHELLARVRV